MPVISSIETVRWHSSAPAAALMDGRRGIDVRRADICLYLGPADRAKLEAIVADRNSPRKLCWRAEIVLGTADGLGTNAIMRRTGKSKPCVWRQSGSGFSMNCYRVPHASPCLLIRTMRMLRPRSQTCGRQLQPSDDKSKFFSQ